MADFYRVGGVSDFSDGLVRVFPVEGVDIAVVTKDGKFHAFSGRCPHADYLLNYTRVRDGNRILCSSHFAWFDLETGKVLSGPTEEDLKQYPVRIEGDDVMVSPEPV
jgi:nitrite reductase/ring-hydroxylating ferredoxin subunit